MASSRKICVGQFAGAHGVRGLVKLRSFTAEAESIFGYEPLTSLEGEQSYKIALKSAAKDHFIITIDGVTNKEEADLLRGERLYISREQLPKTCQGEYYEAELVGLQAYDEKGKNYGKVLASHDHGAGVFLEIGTSKKDSFMLPFKDAFIPKVDSQGGKLLIVVPEGWL